MLLPVTRHLMVFSALFNNHISIPLLYMCKSLIEGALYLYISVHVISTYVFTQSYSNAVRHMIFYNLPALQ